MNCAECEQNITANQLNSAKVNIINSILIGPRND